MMEGGEEERGMNLKGEKELTVLFHSLKSWSVLFLSLSHSSLNLQSLEYSSLLECAQERGKRRKKKVFYFLFFFIFFSFLSLSQLVCLSSCFSSLEEYVKEKITRSEMNRERNGSRKRKTRFTTLS